MSRSDFHLSTLRIIFAAYEGMMELEEERHRAELYRLRWHAQATLTPYMKRPFDWSFEWEHEKQNRPKLTAEQIASISKKLDEADKLTTWRKVTFGDLLAEQIN